jgi:hypothetical protein
MMSKKVLTAVLLGFVAVSVVFAIVKETTKSAPSERTDAERPAVQKASAPVEASPEKVIVYYFRTNVRCAKCIKFEKYSRKAVVTGFQKALENGRLEYKIVNLEEPGNEHYVKDYNLYTKSIVVVEMKGDEQVRWSNLDKIWQMVGSEEKFIDYVQEGVRNYLGEA